MSVLLSEGRLASQRPGRGILRELLPLTVRREMSEERKPTRADLEAMRQEYGEGKRGDKRALPFSLDDDIKQTSMLAERGITAERWARIRGVPVEYARALLRHVEH